MRTAAEIEHAKREIVDEFRKSLLAQPSLEQAVMVSIVRVRQLLDIIYPAPPRNDMADAVAYAWQADAGAAEREDSPTSRKQS